MRSLRRSRRRDRGEALILEVAVVILFLVTSTAVYTAMDIAPARQQPARLALEAAVDDLLDGLEALPVTERYASFMEKAISKAVQGNTSALDNLIKRTLPPGAECRLWIDNGEQRRQLAGPSERLARESVSASRLWRPTWAYTFALPAFDLISELQPLVVQGYMVSQGSLVKEHGVPLTFTLNTTAGEYDRAAVTAARPDAPAASLYLEDGGTPTFHQVQGAAAPVITELLSLTAPGPLPQPSPFTVASGEDMLHVTSHFTGTTIAYTMTFRDPAGQPHQLPVNQAGWANRTIPAPMAGQWTFSATGTVQGGSPSAALWVNSSHPQAATGWTFAVRHDGGEPLRVGTLLNITLPSILPGVAGTPRVQEGWRNVQAGESLDLTAWVSAELDTTLDNDERALVVYASLPGEGNLLYALSATLSNGASARANFVLGSDEGLTTPDNPLDRGLRVSVPKPLASGTSSLWGAVFAAPAILPTATEYVQRLDVRTADGSALFASVQGLSPPGTWTVMAPDHLQWTGNRSATANAAVAFAFEVTTLADIATPDEPAIHIPLDFRTGRATTTSFPLRDMRQPYVYTLNIPPPLDLLGEAQAGFVIPPYPGPNERGNGTFEVAAYQRGMLAHGNTSYGVSAWGTLGNVQEALRTGLAKSQLDISRLTARLGEEVNVSIDFQGLFDEVNLTVSSMTAWNVEVKVFDPAQPFVKFEEMEASLHGTFGASLNLSYIPTRPKLDTIANAEWVASSVDVFTPASANITMRIPRTSFYGPHAVIVQANFLVEDPLTGDSMVQSARVLGVVDIAPDSGQNASALYWALLECWLQDW